MARVAVRQVATAENPVVRKCYIIDRRVCTYLSPAWNSRKTAMAKNDEPMMGTIQWTLGALVQPNQKSEIGRKIPPTIATGSLFSGMKSVRQCDQRNENHVSSFHLLASPFLNIGFRM